ncbi:wound-induced proteinase inhibitor 2-like [Lycium barbarum]|uniref:wound-induced proteinase inhibitor 2-like n=1 Tax=Lycium barbarum TaxID=112863 RepID=UPI00293ECA3B|nr:wound-induced proteinase inhibitor 2-like [Lycium barbarum]
MAIRRANFLVLLIVLGTFLLVSKLEQADAKHCTKNCDPRIDHAICPRSEENQINRMCTNCCAGMKGCNYYSADGTFVCEGESEPGKPKPCPRNCDPRIDHAICPRSEENRINPICTNCCAGMKGCNYYSADGTFVCEGESEVGKPRACPLNCDGRIAYGICPRSEEKRINKICTNCCAGKKSCNYYSSNGTFICKGESEVKTKEEVEHPKPCTLECDPRVAYMTCPSLGLAKLEQVCVNCCMAGEGCKLYDHDGSLISCPKEL